MLSTILGFIFLSSTPVVLGTPLPIFGIGQTKSKGAPTVLSQETVESSFVAAAKFARLAYCPNDQVQKLSCGVSCDAVKGLQVLKVGGDNAATPDFYVGFDSTSKSMVVSHQGTDPKQLLSDINDIKFKQIVPDATKFKGLPSGSKVHDGFYDAWNRSAADVLNTVQAGLKSNNVNNLLVTGHSQGAAIALLDAMSLKGLLSPTVKMTTVVFGLPRVGNQAFANFVDKSLGTTLTHVTNKEDPVPQVPPRILSFQHPAGEVHIDETNKANACPGQENSNCQDKDNILDAKVADHLGPYFDNISFGSAGCKNAVA